MRKPSPPAALPSGRIITLEGSQLGIPVIGAVPGGLAASSPWMYRKQPDRHVERLGASACGCVHEVLYEFVQVKKCGVVK
ncbi:hypothetical protein Acsp04_29160 [Actinomadura sp. NBRC 104425]|nr:hypothetical protein Acsp04_29160 [Actinomadura sp. NBRC 104425]